MAPVDDEDLEQLAERFPDATWEELQEMAEADGFDLEEILNPSPPPEPKPAPAPAAPIAFSLDPGLLDDVSRAVRESSDRSEAALALDKLKAELALAPVGSRDATILMARIEAAEPRVPFVALTDEDLAAQLRDHALTQEDARIEYAAALAKYGAHSLHAAETAAKTRELLIAQATIESELAARQLDRFSESVRIGEARARVEAEMAETDKARISNATTDVQKARARDATRVPFVDREDYGDRLTAALEVERQGWDADSDASIAGALPLPEQEAVGLMPTIDFATGDLDPPRFLDRAR